MALIQNPNIKHVPFLRNRNPQQTLFLPHTLSLPNSKNNSKRLVISNSSSSSLLSPVIHSSPVASPSSPLRPPVYRTPQSPCSGGTVTVPLSRVWREIQGCNNWKDLIEPLNPLLQQEITRYGNLVSTCYKAFDLNPNSKRYLNCKYGKQTLLKETEIDKPEDYQVTKYIYATPDINISPIQDETNRRARWVGYVAVSSDDSVKRLGRRDIVVTFRGTVTNPEWLANFMSSLTPARFHPHNQRLDVKVESGFLTLYTSDESESKFGLESCRQQLLSEISRLINEYKGEEMSITLAGHSMGSSLAQLLAYDIAELGLNRRIGEGDIPVTVFSFAGPRVGNLEFKKHCEELGVKVLRITNVNDPVTKLPGVFLNENFRTLGGFYELPWSCSCYAHVGVELTLDFFDVQNISCVHDLQTYIDLLNQRRISSRSANSKEDEDGDNFALEFLKRNGEKMMLLKEQPMMHWTNAVDLLNYVSNHMLYCNIF
ncbi:PREDICTED: phospholipase A1-Ialpha2, chloroplastic-like [Camelina sativa]|uniref:Phospholipase A1-Ialpha2, chloroplastic-like n=1 Tax=Camelina sativa TaxID=90675 RepID=A0ABM0Z455_CAMSA|nr:PREDICTED: phospholipase A1-Ialpha2, chloroplastic-like [Camelina sativa]